MIKKRPLIQNKIAIAKFEPINNPRGFVVRQIYMNNEWIYLTTNLKIKDYLDIIDNLPKFKPKNCYKNKNKKINNYEYQKKFINYFNKNV